MKYQKSERLYQLSRERIPGGVNSPVRAFLAVERPPLFIDRAKGAHIFDADGNEYIDYVSSWGPCILGHAHPDIVSAVQLAAQDGLTFGAPTERELKLAELIYQCMPSMEMSRMVNSGTEAVMSAIRAARGYTGRSKIIKFSGCYHGHADNLLVKAGSGALTHSVPDSAGVPSDSTKNTLIAGYNDNDSVERIFMENKNEIAAVLVEPVAANMGVVVPEKDFLPFLKEITKSEGALLIFDEVITGFRLGLGGAQEYFGVTPDMTTLGKIVGGGMPAGVYGGRREIMEVVAPAGPVYQAGTLSGNPLATAAGIAAIECLMKTDIYPELEKKTKMLAQTVQELGKGRVCVNRIGSLMSIFFTDREVCDYESAITSDTKAYASYFNEMLNQGIYLAPSQFEAMFVSAAHSEFDIERTQEAFAKCLK